MELVFFICAIVLVLLLVFGALVYLTRTLMHVALDREAPIFLKRRKSILRDIVKNDEFMDSLYSSAERLENSDCERVEISGYGGTRLVGHLLSSARPERIVIAVHGWRSSWSRDFGIIADFWKSCNCSVLFVEQRGQHMSEGELMTFGVLERYDILEWVRFACDNISDKIPIYLCGVSMGATTVLLSTELGLPENIHGIIADCGFTSTMDIWESVVRRLHLPYSLMKRLASKIFESRVGVSPRCCSTLSAMQSCRIPILFVHGEKDEFVPAEMTYKNYAACASKKYILTVKSANHGMSYFMDREGYERAMKSFFLETANG